MKQVFCYEWNDILHRPRDVYSPEEARRRHQDGLLYTELLVDDRSVWRRAVQIRLETKYAYVSRQDDLGRSMRHHTFRRQPDGRLFLNKVQVVGYDGDETANVAIGTYRFDPDGTVRIQHAHDSWPTPLERTDRIEDTSALWEPVPEFGAYDSLARIDRGIPAHVRPVLPRLRPRLAAAPGVRTEPGR